jgi:hypothetical protein
MFGLEVPYYRIFFFDHDNRFVDHRIIDARDDDDAFDIAWQQVKLYGVELWQGPRLIARMPTLKNPESDLMSR